jgi:hypothetical protein
MSVAYVLAAIFIVLILGMLVFGLKRLNDVRRWEQESKDSLASAAERIRSDTEKLEELDREIYDRIRHLELRLGPILLSEDHQGRSPVSKSDFLSSTLAELVEFASHASPTRAGRAEQRRRQSLLRQYLQDTEFRDYEVDLLIVLLATLRTTQRRKVGQASFSMSPSTEWLIEDCNVTAEYWRNCRAPGEAPLPTKDSSSGHTWAGDDLAIA